MAKPVALVGVLDDFGCCFITFDNRFGRAARNAVCNFVFSPKVAVLVVTGLLVTLAVVHSPRPFSTGHELQSANSSPDGPTWDEFNHVQDELYRFYIHPVVWTVVI